VNAFDHLAQRVPAQPPSQSEAKLRFAYNQIIPVPSIEQMFQVLAADLASRRPSPQMRFSVRSALLRTPFQAAAFSGSAEWALRTVGATTWTASATFRSGVVGWNASLLLWAAALLTPRPPELIVLKEPETRCESQSPGIGLKVISQNHGERVHYSFAYFLKLSTVFGAPTTPVVGWIHREGTHSAFSE